MFSSYDEASKLGTFSNYNDTIESKQLSLNSKISNLYALQIHRVKIDNRFLNIHVFWFTHEMSLGQLLTEIQVDVFKPFLNLDFFTYSCKI